MNPSTIKNFRQLANFLRCEGVFLKAYLDGDFYINDRRNQVPAPSITEMTSIIDKLYLPKKDRRSHDYREIYSVQTDMLKSALKTLNTALQAAFEPSPAVHGYVTGKNIRTNAEAHLAKRNLLSVDIHKFFETISTGMVEKALLGIDYSPFAAKHLSQLVTVSGFLPPGFNTSPTISKLVVKEMDDQFTLLCGDKIAYTRYADDLYFSSNNDLPEMRQIEKIVRSNGFSLHPNKTKYMPRGGKQYVTGLTVFDHVRPHISRGIKKKMRLELYYIKKYGLLEHTLRTIGHSVEEYVNDPVVRSEANTAMTIIDRTLKGWIYFMKSVERPAAVKLEALYKAGPR